jgi:hypothetical protein
MLGKGEVGMTFAYYAVSYDGQSLKIEKEKL